MESQGAKVDAYETVNYNGFDGLYFEGSSKTEDETKIILAFEAETFVTMVVGLCHTDDYSSKKELQNIFSSSYYDKSFKLTPLEFTNFQIDETKTGFKYPANRQHLFIRSRQSRHERSA